jgi:rhamnose transport system ATP-binding protein
MNSETQSEPILELIGIYKAFDGTQALAGANFELYPGEIHALVGENGAGKSTLIKVITGVHRADGGEISFRGEPVTITNPLDGQRLGIAAIYQEPTLFPDLDIAENIFMGHHPIRSLTRRVAWRQLYEQAAQPLRALGVDLDPRTRVRGLTVAQLQMVEIAKALSFNAQVLIMDEPTSALTLNEVADLFRTARQLRDGHYVGTREVGEVTHDELIHMMVGRTLDDLFPKLDVEQSDVVLRLGQGQRHGDTHHRGQRLCAGPLRPAAGHAGGR